MVTPEGKVMGRHQGLMFHTLGQRKGLGIGGIKGAEDGVPWFVAGKNLARNELIVVQGHDHPLLLSRELIAADLSWVGDAPSEGRRYTAKTRYRQQDAGCQVKAITDDELRLCFDEPQWAVTPGQSVVLYAGDVCLGGGIIQGSL
jgi:tRNA-specific 2-thiouridylase